MKIDVIIPVYRPGKTFARLLRRLEAQTVPVNRYIVMNTEKEYWDRWLESGGIKLPENMTVTHVTREEFDHGATRHAGILQSDAEICVLMTDDALPADRRLLEKLTRALKGNLRTAQDGTGTGEGTGADREGTAGQAGDRTGGEKIAVAYARQLAGPDAGPIESYTRGFNYPEESRIKTKRDIPELGIKTYFCSNACAAYDRSIYLELGGFIRRTIFNEDMIFAAKAMEHGYAVAYAADARVIHSHNYSAAGQFRRNFDLAVSQADHPEVFAGLRSEGEGIRLVKRTAAYLVREKKAYLIPKLVWQSGFKYMGYLLGKRYRSLPGPLVRRLSMNKNYWET